MAHGFCDCWIPTDTDEEHCGGHTPNLVGCQCGDNEGGHGYSWQWEDTKESDSLVTDRDILFHSTRINGTSIVKGKQSLEPGMVHYWEMCVSSPTFRPDVVLGIGTQDVSLGQCANRYVSALGSNDHSWGLMFSGRIQHCGEQLPYWQNISQGCLVGVYLDRSRGHLEFYLNRKGLGLAYTNVPVDPSVKIYPMVCSTGSITAIRLNNCTSVQDTLQLRSFQALAKKQPDQVSILRQIPGFRATLKSYWFLYLLFHYFE
ncbi:SPRY domain-containing SOCS box protein 3-like [Drosophila subpulchrella]|uniref:SPRY domain-containing SOCS box protein 3-like n=1 Tax=Drosophila subpulchrella TaxID=1486046 RepID=UPI0018A17941|nr:SPRY domain-containing SOCS box protein 3-like [Drosophila subpulchrella]